MSDLRQPYCPSTEGLNLLAPTWRAAGQVFVAAPCTERIKERGQFSVGNAVRLQNELAAFLAALYRRSVPAVCPVSLGLAASIVDPLRGESLAALDPLEGAFWGQVFLPVLHASGCIVVAPLEGWKTSVGVQAEIEIALSRNMRVWVPG